MFIHEYRMLEALMLPSTDCGLRFQQDQLRRVPLQQLHSRSSSYCLQHNGMPSQRPTQPAHMLN
jgi:hypothetical protein